MLMGTKKLESTPDVEVDQAVFLRSKSYFIEKPSNAIESKQRK